MAGYISLSGQTYKYVPGTGYNWERGEFIKVLHVPSDNSDSINGPLKRGGAIRWNPDIDSVQYWNGSSWYNFAASSNPALDSAWRTNDTIYFRSGSGAVFALDAAPASGSPKYIQNQNVAPQTSADFNIDGIGQADSLIGVRGLGIGQDFRWTNSFGSVQLLHLPTGNVPLSTFGSSGIGIEGGLILGGGNTSMDFGGTIAPKFLEFTNFVNPNQLGTTSHHVLMYDPVSSRAKYLPFATVSAGITKTLDDVVQANHTTVNDSIVIAPATNSRAIFAARATGAVGTAQATFRASNGSNAVQMTASPSAASLSFGGTSGSITLNGSTSNVINWGSGTGEINWSGASTSRLVASTAGLDFRNSSLTQTNLISSTGTMTGGAATAANMFTTRGQVSDTLNARFGAITLPNLQSVTNTGNTTTNAVEIGSGGGNGWVRLSPAVGASGWTGFYLPGGTRLGYIGSDPTNMNYVAEGSAKHVFTGDVGIGVAPATSYALTVAGLGKFVNTNSNLNIGELDANTTFIQSINNASSAGKDLAFFNTAERMRLTTAGNFGIGTSAPDYKLQVNSGHLFLTGGTSPPASGSGMAAWIGAGSTGVIRSRNFTAGTDNDIALVGDDALVQGATSVQLTAPITQVSGNMAVNGWIQSNSNTSSVTVDRGFQSFPAFTSYSPMFEMKYQDISTGDNYGFNIQAEHDGSQPSISLYHVDPSFGAFKAVTFAGSQIQAGSLGLASNIIHTGQRNNGKLNESTRTISTASPFSVLQNDRIILLEGMGTGAGTGVVITLPDPAFDEGRVITFMEYSASTWNTSRTISRSNAAPLSTITGTMTIQVVGGAWRLVSSY